MNLDAEIAIPTDLDDEIDALIGTLGYFGVSEVLRSLGRACDKAAKRSKSPTDKRVLRNASRLVATCGQHHHDFYERIPTKAKTS